MTVGPDILLHVEDPGAANLVVGLPEDLSELGVVAHVQATGAACHYLAERDTPFRNVSTGDRLLDESLPSLIVLGTSEDRDGPEFSLLRSARRHKLPSVGLVDSPANANRRFRGNSDSPLAHLPDSLIVTDALTRDTFINVGVPRQAIYVAANPQLARASMFGSGLSDVDIKALRTRHFSNAPSPVLVFLSELSTGLEPKQFQRCADYTLGGRGGSDLRTYIVLEELLDATRYMATPPSIFLHLHPKEEPGAYSSYADELAGIASSGNPLEFCYGANLVVGMTTTLLAECRRMGQRVISILPRAIERFWLADIAAGDIPFVGRTNEVPKQIAKALRQPRRRPDLIEEKPMAKVLFDLLIASGWRPPASDRRCP